MTTSQATLFEPQEPADRPFLLTNRYNLLEMLSSRLVEPVEAFTKYYRDLLELCPGRIPLIASPFPADPVSLVSSEDTTAFPVAIEIERQVLGPGTPELELPGEGDSGRVHAWAPAGIIPLRYVVGIHFRSAAELGEHRLRDYENIRHPEDLYRVSPELYEGPGGRADELLDWFRSTGVTSSAASPGGIDPDRLGGAIALMASGCPAEEPAIETLRRCLDRSSGRKRKKPYADWLVPAVTAKPSRKPSIDETLFTISLRIFAGVDPSQSWHGAEVLSKIHDVVTPVLDAADRDQLDGHFKRMRQILRSERPFERLRPHGRPAEKALLLALMRPDPARLSAWSPDETGADWSVTLAAAALVGALKGRRKMRVELRTAGLDDLLAGREAAMRNGLAESTVALDATRPIRLEASSTAGGRRLRLVAGGTMLGAWDLPREAESAIGRLTRWTEAGDAATESALIGLCDELGWHDCTMTVIDTMGRPLEQEEPGATRYWAPGPVTLERRLKPDGLLAKLESAEATSEARARALTLLEAGSQSGTDSQRYSN